MFIKRYISMANTFAVLLSTSVINDIVVLDTL